MTSAATRRALVGVLAAVALGAVAHTAWAGNPVTPESLLRMVIFALPIAGAYAISATGLVVVHSATGIFNIAQGAIGMVCAFTYWELSVGRGVDPLLAAPLVVLVVAPVLGLVLDRVMMRELARTAPMMQLIGAVGVMVTLLGVATTLWDPNESYPLEPLGGSGGVRIAGILLTWHRVITIAVAVVLAVMMRWLLFSTRLGVSMRAVVDDPELASLHGIRPGRVSGAAWAIGCSCAALAGILIAPEVGNMSAETLTLLIISAFAAAVFGRLRSLPLTYLGALVIGILVSFSTSFLQLGGRWTTLPGALPAICLFVILLLLPESPVQLGRTIRTHRMERVPTWRTATLAAAATLAALVLVLPLLSDVNVARLTVGFTIGVILLGLVPLVGWAGQPFFAPYALAGVGAWLTWRLADVVPGPLAIVVAGLGTAAIGVVAALPALRLRGLYLALSSIAFALVTFDLVLTQPGVLAEARQVDRPSIFGFDLHSPHRYLGFVLVTYLVLAVALVGVRRSRLGRRLVATRDSEAAAACVGIGLLETKVLVFALAGLVAGIGGGLMAYGQRFVSVEQFPMVGGLAIVLSLSVWGVGTTSGPLLAGLFATLMVMVSQDWATGDWTHALETAGPGLAVLALIHLPRGQVPEIVAHARAAPAALACRFAGVVVGGAVGVLLDMPGVVGVALAVIGAVAGGTVAALVAQRRSGALDLRSGRASTEGAVDLDDPALGLGAALVPSTARRLEGALGVAIEAGR